MRAQVQAFIAQGGDFEQTALDLYRWQRAHNPQYDRFCGAADPQHFTEIPAVPAPLFRDLHLTSFAVDDAVAVFHTSGTTTGRPGRVHLSDCGLYESSARQHAEQCLGPLPSVGVSLVSDAPTSSLGHMCRAFVPGMTSFFSLEHGVDADGAWQALRRLASRHPPRPGSSRAGPRLSRPSCRLRRPWWPRCSGPRPSSTSCGSRPSTRSTA